MTAEQTASVERVRAAVAEATGDYVTALAGDIVNLFAAAGEEKAPLAVHAAREKADARMSVHRVIHLGVVMAKLPPATPPATPAGG